MFEHTVLRRAEGDSPISAGYVAEALLYYQKVHLFLDRGTVFRLVSQIGPEPTMRLLRRPEVSAVYCEEQLGTHSESFGVTQRHNFIAFSFAGSQEVGRLRKPVDRLAYELETKFEIPKRQAKQFAKQFIDHVPIRNLSGNHYLPGGVIAAARNDLRDTEYVRAAIGAAANVLPGGYDAGEHLQFKIIDTESGFFAISDLDLDRINTTRGSLIPPVDPLTIPYLLSKLLDARADLSLASFYGGDFVTSESTSAIIRTRHSELLRRASIDSDDRERFQDLILPDMPKLAEVIDSGERSFEEFTLLLDRAERFKKWLNGVSPDEGLIRTYLKDASADGWIQRIPAKIVRYLLATVAGALNPGAGVAAGLADSFLIEKLLGGWRPSHFIKERLRPFIEDAN